MDNTEALKELAEYLNRHGFDNQCNTPDYILAANILRYIDNYRQAMTENMAWHGWKDILGNQVQKEA